MDYSLFILCVLAKYYGTTYVRSMKDLKCCDSSDDNIKA